MDTFGQFDFPGPSAMVAPWGRDLETQGEEDFGESD